MMKLSDYLDKAAEITGSDYQTAKALGMTRSAISLCRSKGTMKTDNVVALAELIGVNPAQIVAACDIAKNPENAKVWAKWGVAATVIMAVAISDIFSGNQVVTAATALDAEYTLCELMLHLLLPCAGRHCASLDVEPREHRCPLG